MSSVFFQIFIILFFVLYEPDFASNGHEEFGSKEMNELHFNTSISTKKITKVVKMQENIL